MQAGESTGSSHSGVARFEDCRFVNNTCASMGGVVYAEDGNLTFARSSVRGSVARETGGVIIARNANVTLIDSSFDGNVAVTSGGVVSAFGYKGAVLNVTNCSMTGNVVKMGNGGALSLTGGRTWIRRSRFVGNNAYQGGALAFQSSCIDSGDQRPPGGGADNSSGGGQRRRLSEPASAAAAGAVVDRSANLCGEQLLWIDAASVIRGNNATLSGGGVQVQAWQDASVDLAGLTAASKDNHAQVGGDIAISPYEIAFKSDAPPPSAVFASREGRSQGLLPLAVAVYGPNRTPVSGVRVRVAVRSAGAGGAAGSAVLLGAEGLSDAGGVADLPLLKLRARPGAVSLGVELPDYPGVTPLRFEVAVRECEPGEVRSDSGDTCTPCGLTTYSLSPGNVTCDECPAHATCPGGAIVTPNAGYW
jgi:hypothetical protein